MLVDQEYKCAICGILHVEESRKRLHVDHCHLTNKVRGLLCHDCNNMIGRAKDNIQVMLSAIDYITRYL